MCADEGFCEVPKGDGKTLMIQFTLRAGFSTGLFTLCAIGCVHVQVAGFHTELVASLIFVDFAFVCGRMFARQGMCSLL